MTVLALLIYIVVVALLGWLCVWLLGMLAPGHPGIIDNIIWAVVVLCIVVILLQAFGLVGHGPMVPRLG